MFSLSLRAATIVLLGGVALLALRSGADEPPKKTEAKRKPWTTSKITGSPEPPPKFKSVRVFPEVKFSRPSLIAHCPGSDRLFVGEHETSMVYSLANKPDAKKDVFCDLKKDIKTLDKTPTAKEVAEFLALVFHPKFEENRYCYIAYRLDAKDPKVKPFPDGTRVSRFTVTKTDPPRIDPASEEITFTFPGGGHNGCDLHFGPDGMLYITTGDGSGPNPPDELNTGQDCSDLLGSILRIDVNKKDADKNHAVPKDNPFVGMKDVRPEIWAFGFRNPWRMSFDRKTGDLWVGDVGWELWEMVYKIEKGGNYGWSITEGRQPVKPNQKIGPTPIRPPTIELSHTIAASVTGGYVYRGKKFPELVGAYIFGDWETRRIWAARFEGERLKEMPEIVKPNVRVSAFGEDNAGEIYYVDYDTGFLYTLERNDAGAANTKFPTKLSETGLFKSVNDHEMADGVIPFSPNVSQWQDGATARYYLALPGPSSITLFDKPRQLPGQVFWHDFRMQFPKDAVLVKSVSVNHGFANPGDVRLETQILHFDGEDWRGYTYAWRDGDAHLVPPEGAEVTLSVKDPRASGGERLLVWPIHSRNQCMSCHNAWSEYTLAFNVRQLNGGRKQLGLPNYLIDFTQQGIIRRVSADNRELPPFDEKTASTESAIPNYFRPDGTVYSIEEQARGYLHVNCSHCHRFGGGGGQVVLELDFSRPLKDTGIFDARPRQGDFGIPDARIIAPGDPHRSVLFYRMAKFGRGRMPHLGSDYPDHAGLELMNEWISSLGKKPAVPAVKDLAGLDRAFTSIATALPFACGSFKETDRDKLLAAAAKLEPGPVRDLFDGYLPADPKGRKLGSNPRPAAILALTGDATKGEALFFNKEMKCATCHNVGDRGTQLGADLTKIGANRTRAEILDSLLNPSARIDPQFASYNVKTKDEKTYTGLLVKRDEKQLILRDAENKEIKLAADNVESVTPSRLSLMPDGQMNGLTPQEAADLLEYLVQRKGP